MIHILILLLLMGRAEMPAASSGVCSLEGKVYIKQYYSQDQRQQKGNSGNGYWKTRVKTDCLIMVSPNKDALKTILADKVIFKDFSKDETLKALKAKYTNPIFEITGADGSFSIVSKKLKKGAPYYIWFDLRPESRQQFYYCKKSYITYTIQ